MVKGVLHGACRHTVKLVVGILEFQRLVLEALRSIYLVWVLEVGLCVEVSLVSMFWEEKWHMLNQVMIMANLQPFYQSMRVINSFK